MTWDAVSGADSYALYRNTAPSGSGTEIATPDTPAFDDTTATPLTQYYYRAQACNANGCGAFSAWDAGNRGDSGGGGNPGNGGSLSGVMMTSSANASLSDGASDFLKPGATTVRLADVVPQISAIFGIGDTTGRTYSAAKFGQQWTNGTPQLSGDNVRTGVRVFNNGKGLGFSVNADTATRTLKIWLTGRGLSGEALNAALTASLSDGSAAPFSTTISNSGTAKIGKLITLTYSAESGGETLDVELIKSGGNWIAIDGLSLAGGGNIAPVFDPIGPQTITEGDLLHLDIMATDPENAGVTLSMSHNLPGAEPSFTDNGGGMGTFDWQSAMGDTGNFEITITAVDGDLNSSELNIPVSVRPVGGGTGVLTVTSDQVTDRNKTLSGTFIKYAPTNSIPQATNSSGAQPFGPIEPLGGALAGRSPKSKVRYSYTGAAPADGSGVKGGNRVFDPLPRGMEIDIDAGTEAQSATVYIGVQDVLARAVVSLSDDSMPPVTVDIDQRGQLIQTFALNLDFATDSNGEHVSIELYVIEHTNDSVTGWVQFEAAEQ